MPKHQTNNPQLQELYDVVRDLPGIRAIDGRSGDILFIANVEVLSGIISRLTGEYGKPTEDHPLLNDIVWRVREDYRILVQKADSMDGTGTLHHLYAMSF